MTIPNKKVAIAVENYFSELHRIRASGAATDERSSYGPIVNLLNAVGASLRPRVFCVGELANQGAGHPDMGIFSANQLQKGRPHEGQIPERCAVEVKPLGDVRATAVGEQVARYWSRYRTVLVTDANEFILVGENEDRKLTLLEHFQVAESAEEFCRRLETPRSLARDVSTKLGEYLSRAISHRTVLTEPGDLASLLASYARDGLSRVETVDDSASLASVRSALEAALGVRFEGEKGTRFFRSTLVQTLFYGVFSAWVLWARQTPTPVGRFNWREAVWHLRAPIMQALFQQLSQPGRLQPLGLVEVLDWTSAALNRVDRTAFFTHFNEGEVVTYFYEPFLQAFDPELRKQLGVWYTPTEVVHYMVARVDKALKDDLGIAEGLASENVYVLDPCCGTGAFLAEVLRCIATNLETRGLGALVGSQVKRAAMERVFGFEILPAPFVVAHLQIGLAMQALDATLADNGTERAQVFLTNALTGWHQRGDNPIALPELEEERRRAGKVKQDTPILVILGNPPYNGFAGMAVDEERDLSNAYRATKHVRRPEGHGLNDLYVRFFRMAERRIAKTGQGVVCFISNYSWLDGLSFTGMRENYLETFDTIRIDCLNGDKYKTGKLAPDGTPDPSIFSTEADPTGIQVGTAITMLLRKADHTDTDVIGFRHLWGQQKHTTLTETADADPDAIYNTIEPVLPLGLPFAKTAVSRNWFDWPALPELLPVSFPGVKTSRDGFLVDTDLNRLRARVNSYFDRSKSHSHIAQSYPSVMKSTARFDAQATRDALLERGGPIDDGFIRFSYRPFDNRWLYWEADTELLDRKRAEYRPHIYHGNMWLSAAKHLRRGAEEPQMCFTEHLASLHLIERGAHMFPAYLHNNDLWSKQLGNGHRPNLSGSAQVYLQRLGKSVEDLFYHVLSVLHDPIYRRSNSGALALGWPRIPLPGWPDGRADGAADDLAKSAARGRELAALLNAESPMPGVTQAELIPEIATIAVPSTTDGRNITGDGFAVTTGWGHYGTGDAVMPGTGRVVERAYTKDEKNALESLANTLGERTLDVYLNDHVYWQNVPVVIWEYKLGGYQVLKKWLSYREHEVLGRALKPNEVFDFSEMARRVGRLLIMSND